MRRKIDPLNVKGREGGPGSCQWTLRVGEGGGGSKELPVDVQEKRSKIFQYILNRKKEKNVAVF